MDVLIPSLGDIDEVEVIELCIEPGAAVATGDTLIVIESDKASMDVPANCDGILQAYAVQLGDLVSEGTLIATVAPDAGEADSLASEDVPVAAATTTLRKLNLRRLSLPRLSRRRPRPCRRLTFWCQISAILKMLK